MATGGCRPSYSETLVLPLVPASFLGSCSYYSPPRAYSCVVNCRFAVLKYAGYAIPFGEVACLTVQIKSVFTRGVLDGENCIVDFTSSEIREPFEE